MHGQGCVESTALFNQGVECAWLVNDAFDRFKRAAEQVEWLTKAANVADVVQVNVESYENAEAELSVALYAFEGWSAVAQVLFDAAAEQ